MTNKTLLHTHYIEPSNVGIQLRMIRKRLGLTQEEAAKRAGMGRVYYGRIELGKVTGALSLSKLYQAFNGLGCNITVLGFEIKQEVEK